MLIAAPHVVGIKATRLAGICLRARHSPIATATTAFHPHADTGSIIERGRGKRLILP